jgi:hypothetical protein
MAKRQHFVPRFYLKNFSQSSSLFCYDKTNDNVMKTSNDIALEKNFYELEGLERGFVENFLSEHENNFSKAYNELIKQKDISKLSQESINDFFLFMASQMLRTLGYRLDLENVLSRVYDKVFSPVANNFLKKEESRLAGHVRVSAEPEEGKLMQLQNMMENLPLFAHILTSKKWWINENFYDIPLWTSDNPVVLRNELNQGRYRGNLGLLSPGIEIHFPLTKNLRLFSFDTRTCIEKKYDGHV